MPYSHTTVTPQQVHILFWRLSETIDELIELWGKEKYPQRYDSTMTEKRRCEIMATALLLRQHFGKDITINYTTNGAPIIDNGYISISHTATYVVIAIHPLRPVGVDIETIGKKAVRVMERFLSPKEIAILPTEENLLTCETSYRTEAIHLAWSVKECIYKIHPSAIEFRKDIILSSFNTLPEGEVTAWLSNSNTTIQAFYTIHDGCSLAWALL